MPQLIKNRVLVEDAFIAVGDEEALPAAPALLSLARWQAERVQLLAHGFPLGVRLSNHDRVAILATDLDALALVALEFPNFPDGRAYSQARLLRQRLGYAGELRATGAVVADQLREMARCGFDAIELPDGVDAASALTLLDVFSVSYQGWLPV